MAPDVVNPRTGSRGNKETLAELFNVRKHEVDEMISKDAREDTFIVGSSIYE